MEISFVSCKSFVLVCAVDSILVELLVPSESTYLFVLVLLVDPKGVTGMFSSRMLATFFRVKK